MPFVVSSLRALLSSFDMSLSLLISVCSYSAYACDRGFRVLPYQRWRNRKLQKFCLLPVTLDQHVRSASSSVSSAEGSLSYHPLSAPIFEHLIVLFTISSWIFRVQKRAEKICELQETTYVQGQIFKYFVWSNMVLAFYGRIRRFIFLCDFSM